MKKIYTLTAILMIASMLMTACNNPLAPAPTPSGAQSQATEIVATAQFYATGTAQSQEDAQTIANANAEAARLLGQVTPTATLAPTAVPPTVGPSSTPTTEPIQPTPTAANVTTCQVINDYQLKGLTEISTAPGGYIQAEWFTNGPEYESVFPSGRYTVNYAFTGGHVWEYPGSCSVDQVLADVAVHIVDRLNLKANNGGYKQYQTTLDNGLFKTVVMTGSASIPSTLP